MPRMMLFRTAVLAVAVLLPAACGGDNDRVNLADMPLERERCDVPPPPEGLATVQVVFSCDEEPASTWRPLADGTQDTLRFALEALLEGPISAEQAVGLHSFFSEATGGMLNDVTVVDGVAYIDFQDFSGVIPNASTSAGSRMLLDQIAGTVFQFDAITEAELSFDRSCDAFWNWLQRDCERLQRSGS